MADNNRKVESPFPGMDPYLEYPQLWPDVHNRLITMMANALTPHLRPHYYAAIEERVYLAAPAGNLVGRSDVSLVESDETSPWPRVEETTTPYRPLLINLPAASLDEVREPYLEVREVKGQQVVTVIELLSPTNKQRGSAGYQRYLQKRLDILNSHSHLVEIDLLRGGPPLPMEVSLAGHPPPSDYRIIVSRSWQRPQAHLYAFGLREPIPDCPVPLKSETEEEPLLKLQDLLHTLYEQAGYDLRIDYSQEPLPPLREADAVWAAGVLQVVR